MSNRRSSRRPRQRRRYEKSRRPAVITKAMDMFLAMQPIERARKARAEYWSKRNSRDLSRSRRYLRELARKNRKPRTVYGKTFWNHSHDA